MANEQAKLRVMVDANILISGTAWPRWPYEVLQHALRGDFQLVLSQYVIDQAQRHFRGRFADHAPSFTAFLQSCGYELVADPTKEEVRQNQDLVRDVTDVPIALAAINAQVDYLVSEDKDLTEQDEATAVLRQSLTVYLSGTFLREVMAWSTEDLAQVRRRSWHDL